MSGTEKKEISDRKYEAALHPDDPRIQVFILAERVEALTKEKEKLEKDYAKLNERVQKMEKSFDRGAGILLVLPIIGGFIGWIVSYWKVISKPWATP